MKTQGERVFLTFDEAVALIPAKERVHTFTNPAHNVLVGADWDREEILKLMRSCPDAECAEVAGAMAQDMGHGIVIRQGHGGLLFVEAAEWKPATVET